RLLHVEQPRVVIRAPARLFLRDIKTARLPRDGFERKGRDRPKLFDRDLIRVDADPADGGFAQARRIGGVFLAQQLPHPLRIPPVHSSAGMKRARKSSSVKISAILPSSSSLCAAPQRTLSSPASSTKVLQPESLS